MFNFVNKLTKSDLTPFKERNLKAREFVHFLTAGPPSPLFGPAFLKMSVDKRLENLPYSFNV